MAGTFTLKGKFKRNDGVTPYVNSTIHIAAAPFPDLTDDVVYSSSFSIVTDSNGAFSITLVTETSLYYRISSDDGLFDPNPFTFAAPTAGTILDVTDLTLFDPSTITSTIAAQAAASAAAAAASAASVVREGNSGVAGLDANGLPIRSVPLWRASTAFATGQTVQAPNSGALLRRIAAGTARASFDATEQALWLPVTGVWDIRTFDAVADFGSGNTDNAAKINNTISACNAAGGGTVLIPAAALPWGKSGPIVTKANVSLMVFGTTKELASSTGAGITATDVSNVEICGPGTIDMNKAATTNGGSITTQQGIVVKTGSATAITRVRIRDVMVVNCWHYGIHVSAGVASSSVSDVLIDHVTVSAAGQDGINVGGLGDPTGVPATSRGVWVTRSLVTNPTVNGIQVTGASDVHIDKNVVTATASTGHGICMGAGSGGVTTDHVTDFTVTGNRVRGFTGTSVWGIVVSARCNRFNVSGNDVRGCSGGMAIDVTDPNNVGVIQETDGSIGGNTLVGSTVTHGLYVNFAKGLTITGNTSRGNAGSGILVASSSGVAIVGNNSKANTGAGVALTGTTAGMGGHTVQGNNVSGNTGGDFYNECPVVSLTDIAAQSTLTAQQSFANTTAETTQFTYVIPANTVQAGTTYRVTLFYMVDNIAGSGTLTLRSYGWNGGLNLTTVVLPSSAGAGAGSQIIVEHLITVRNISTTVGKVMPVGNLRSQFSAVSQAFGGTVVTANTVATASLIFTAQWATANAGNICRLEYAAVEVVKS